MQYSYSRAPGTRLPCFDTLSGTKRLDERRRRRDGEIDKNTQSAPILPYNLDLIKWTEMGGGKSANRNSQCMYRYPVYERGLPMITDYVMMVMIVMVVMMRVGLTGDGV